MFTENQIEKLTQRGFSRWTKGNMDRMYINAESLGLKCDYYKTGNIASATFNGEKISNAEANRIKAAKTYINLVTGEVVSTRNDFQEIAEELMNDILSEDVKSEEAAEETEGEALTVAEVSELARALDWGNPIENKDDFLDSLRTNWATTLTEESVQAVYSEMCRVWNDANAYIVAVADRYGHQAIDTELTLTDARAAVAEYEAVDAANGAEHEYVILDSREDNKMYGLHD